MEGTGRNLLIDFQKIEILIAGIKCSVRRGCKRQNPLTLLAQSSPEAQRTQTDVTVGSVGKAHAAVGAADLVAHAVAALTWHRVAGRKLDFHFIIVNTCIN